MDCVILPLFVGTSRRAMVPLLLDDDRTCIHVYTKCSIPNCSPYDNSFNQPPNNKLSFCFPNKSWTSLARGHFSDCRYSTCPFVQGIFSPNHATLLANVLLQVCVASLFLAIINLQGMRSCGAALWANQRWLLTGKSNTANQGSPANHFQGAWVVDQEGVEERIYSIHWSKSWQYLSFALVFKTKLHTVQNYNDWPLIGTIKAWVVGLTSSPYRILAKKCGCQLFARTKQYCQGLLWFLWRAWLLLLCVSYRVTLEDLYNGKSTKLQLSKNVICATCRGWVFFSFSSWWKVSLHEQYCCYMYTVLQGHLPVQCGPGKHTAWLCISGS